MKSMKLINFFTLIVLVMLLSTLTTNATTTIDQSRPNVIYRKVNQHYQNQIVKGNITDSPVEFLLNSATRTVGAVTVRGDPTVTQTADNITLQGNILASTLKAQVNVTSGYQNDSYLEQFPVGERFRIGPFSRSDTNSAVLPIDETFNLTFSYGGLQSNDNFTDNVRSDLDLTAFVHRSGQIVTTTINDTNGDPTVDVVGFRINLLIFIYQTSTEDLVGLHTGVIWGFGNIFPARVISYISDLSLISDVPSDIRGADQLRGQDRISWYYDGYNSTLGLDIYAAQFQLFRSSQSLLLSPPSEGQLALSSVSTQMEVFMTELETEYVLDIEQSDLDEFDNNILDNAINQEAVELDTSPSSLSDSGDDEKGFTQLLSNSALLGGQLLALVILGGILFRRLRR